MTDSVQLTDSFIESPSSGLLVHSSKHFAHSLVGIVRSSIATVHGTMVTSRLTWLKIQPQASSSKYSITTVHINASSLKFTLKKTSRNRLNDDDDDDDDEESDAGSSSSFSQIENGNFYSISGRFKTSLFLSGPFLSRFYIYFSNRMIGIRTRVRNVQTS